MALEVDSASATFQDTAVVIDPQPAEPEPEAVKRTPAPPREPAREVTASPPPVEAPIPDKEAPVQPEAAVEPEPGEAVVRPGTLLRVALDQELSTRSNQPGDAFTATLLDAVVADDGVVLLPEGAIVRGRVVHVQESGRVGETAVLNVAFETIRIDDVSHPLDATVVQANPERVTRQSTGEQVGKVAVGAAAGAILGRVLGGRNRDAVKGAVVGAAAGTAIALGTADVDAVLKAGSAMVIRTDSPITIVLRDEVPGR
ncbi:MAG: hypothetical protein L0271_18390 [Gemmatimonadetes bacterium]|nr:hypothetical protein [Gemmatimonadota bacterium]